MWPPFCICWRSWSKRGRACPRPGLGSFPWFSYSSNSLSKTSLSLGEIRYSEKCQVCPVSQESQHTFPCVHMYLVFEPSHTIPGVVVRWPGCDDTVFSEEWFGNHKSWRHSQRPVENKAPFHVLCRPLLVFCRHLTEPLAGAKNKYTNYTSPTLRISFHQIRCGLSFPVC